MSRSVELTHRVPCSVANTFVDENGLLFLPAACLRYGGVIVVTSGYYWSRSLLNASWTDYVRFTASEFVPLYNNVWYKASSGVSVRLGCLAQ